MSAPSVSQLRRWQKNLTALDEQYLSDLTVLEGPSFSELIGAAGDDALYALLDEVDEYRPARYLTVAGDSAAGEVFTAYHENLDDALAWMAPNVDDPDDEGGDRPLFLLDLVKGEALDFEITVKVVLR